MTQQRGLYTFAGAIVLRLVLFTLSPELLNILAQRAEIATPLNAQKRLQEGLFLYERGLDPYDGGIFHQAPLLLSIFSLIPSLDTILGRIISAALYTTLDIFSAYNLYLIASSETATTGSNFVSPRKNRSWQPITVAAIFLYNPFTLLSSLARTTTPFTTVFTLLSIRCACEAQIATTAFALAFASYLSLHPLLLLPATGFLCYDQLLRKQLKPSPSAFSLTFAACFITSSLLLLALSRLLLPSWNFLFNVYVTPLTLPDLTPNPGLWWYFFIEMFDAFREFFLGVFWLHMLAYSVPLCIRMRKTPLAAAIGMTGVVAVFQPYANVGDAGTWLAGLSLFGHVLEGLSDHYLHTSTDHITVSSHHRYTFPAMATLLYAALLGPAFHYLWIYAGSGNANFFYAITLVWSSALLILLADFVYAVLRDQWEAERPEGVKKEIRQI